MSNVGGAGILATVPSPPASPLHKLVNSGQRTVAEQTKSAKDLRLAEALLEVLVEDRPGDLRVAWAALEGRLGARAVQGALRNFSLE